MFRKLGIILAALAMVAVMGLTVGTHPASAQVGYPIAQPYALNYSGSAVEYNTVGSAFTVTCYSAYCPYDTIYSSGGYAYGVYGGYYYVAPYVAYTAPYAAPTVQVCSNGFVSTWYGCQALYGYAGYSPNVITVPVTCHYDNFGRWGHWDRGIWRGGDCR